MKPLVKFFSLSLCMFVLAIAPLTAQTPAGAQQEFRSILGRFGIQLSQDYSDYKAEVSLEISGRHFFVNIYRWNTPLGQFSVGYSDSIYDLETPEQSAQIQTGFRAQLLGHSGKGSKLVSQREITLESHPGLELITESSEARTVTQVFLVNHRVYFVTMSGSAQQLESVEATKSLSSFRLLSADALEQELRTLVAKLTPPLLPQEPYIRRPTTDAQDEGLKGKVKTIIIKEESTQPGGPNSLLTHSAAAYSRLEFDERGNRLEFVEYAGGLPTTIVVYGYLNGERAAKMMFESLGAAVKQTGKDYLSRGEPKIESLTLKYKYEDSGRLIERRVLLSDGKVFELNTYNLKNKKMEHLGGSETAILLKTKITYFFGDDGSPVSEDRTNSYRSGPSTFVAGGQVYHGDQMTDVTTRYFHIYEYDAQGNWIRRITNAEGKDKKQIPHSITNRTIIYF